MPKQKIEKAEKYSKLHILFFYSMWVWESQFCSLTIGAEELFFELGL